MTYYLVVTFLAMMGVGYAINRPVYKIVLTQKGYTQFLQYDLETPPLREFTFCTWIRAYDLSGDQTIFTYVANGNNRLIRLWLDSGGRSMKIAIDNKMTAEIPVELARDVWRHICLSYQSDFGAWALYIDAKLQMCQSAQNLYGFELPAGGSVIIGYGTGDNGAPNGFEGEIFGANMFLASTIERNYTSENNHLYRQNGFKKNKLKDGEKNIKYVILSDLQTDEIHNNFEKVSTPSILKGNNSFVRFRTPYTSIDYDVGLIASKKSKTADVSSEKEILDLTAAERLNPSTENNKINFWNIVNTEGREGKFKVNKKEKSNREQTKSSTKDLPMLSEFETPPPPDSQNSDYMKNLEIETSPMPKSFYNTNYDFNGQINMNKKAVDLPDIEVPPPVQKNTKVYGQWTSSKFAGSVLNYLKSINFNNRDKKIPPLIPLTKVSDSYPYPSEFKLSKLRPPVKFQRRNFIDHRFRLKRDINPIPEINVQVIKEDQRSDILKMHAETRPKDVEIIHRGANKNSMDSRFYRNVDSYGSSEEISLSMENINKPRPFSNINKTIKHSRPSSDFEPYTSYITILPFLKSLEYFIDDSLNKKSQHVLRSTDMYTKSLSNPNKWHNVKSYSNDYTPRHINIDSEDEHTNINHKIADVNKKHPSIRLKYKQGSHTIKPGNKDLSIAKGRQLAIKVSNQSNINEDSISIIKYNHGHLPSQEKLNKFLDKTKSIPHPKKSKVRNNKHSFNKQVKIGNALNEHHLIGDDEEQKKNSFVEGYENVPDINKYRSDIDNENTNVPGSLSSRVCENIHFGSRLLYIQQDESIITSHIESPLREKNVAAEFIQQNYNKCSLDGSNFEKSYLLFIDWSKTPVKLFGGAYPKTTTDLCGFF